MSLVIDASVALKWVFDEERSEAARAVIGAQPLLAPDFLTVECANVLAMKAISGRITAADAAFSLTAIRAVPMRRVPAADLLAPAQALAIELGQSVYDCLYLALALVEAAPMLTADHKFVRAVGIIPAYADAVRTL